MELDKIRGMIQPKAVVPDNTRHEAWQVFSDKSQEGDTMKENALGSLKKAGLTEEDILGLVMGSVGGGGAGRGVMQALKGMAGRGGFKGLAGKIGSKMRFPQGYGAPQSPGSPSQMPAFARKAVDNRMNPMQQMQNEGRVRSIIQESIDQLMKPNTVIKKEGVQKALKGMRKVGIRG